MQETTTATATTTPALATATATTAATTTTATTATTSNTVVTMTTTKFKDVILETIDQLRQRKARPDLVRISHMLQRKHGISFHETEAILGKLVDSQVVFKVDYKGSTSYRNAAKWRINHLASSGGGGSGTGALTQNSDQVSQKIREAVRALAGGGGNSSSLTSSNNSNNNNNTSSSSNASGSGGGGGGGRRGRQQQQQQNNDNKNSGAQTSSPVTAASKKSSAASKSSAPANTFNHAGEKDPALVGSATTTTTATTTKKAGSNVRADKASTHLRTTSSEDKNNNSKSPAGGSVAPAAAAAAAAAAAVSLASSLTAASQTSSTRRSGKKEQTGPVGVSLKDLEGWLTKQDSCNPLVKNLLVTALQREVQAGWLKRLRNGNYIDAASVANSNSKKKNTNNKSNKNTSGGSGPPTSPALASTQVTSPSSSISTSIVSPADDATVAKNHPNTTTATPNTNKNSIIIITDSGKSCTNSATIVTSPPSISSFNSHPVKPNISLGIKRSAPPSPFLDATQQLISQPTPAIIPSSDVTGQHGTTLVLVPSSSPTTTPVHPTLLLPLSPAQTPTDPDRRTAPLTTSSVSASSFSSSSSSSSSSSLSPSSVSASFGSNHNNNALARVSLSSALSTSTTSTGTPGLSREGAPARRDNNNVKTAKSAAIQPAGPTNAPVLAKRGRPASKRKRFKKTPGPEFETEDILKSEQEKCVSCSLTAQANKHGQPEELLICKDCNTTVHPSCMNYCEELAVRARNSPWQCIECKTCYVCDDSGDADSMLFCDACDKGYHMKCHVPHVEQKPKGKWVCGQCVSESGNSLEQPMEFETSNSEESQASSPSVTGICREPMEASGPSCLPTPCDSPVQPDPEEKEIGREDESISLPMLRDFQGPYPDAANWTIDDVVNFFKSAGFVSQAEAFREQEIDGKSLLLMKRSDVLTGLSLKLGPALKMYTHVQNLQLVGQSSFVNGTGH